MTFAEKAIEYFINLNPEIVLPAPIRLMNPYSDANVKNVIKDFYNKYYNDTRKRIYIFGINPGRFGGGLTGISFTDPVALRKYCRIENNLGNQKELSSEFVYAVILEFGGVERFFSNFFLSALFPLAILNDGKNYNYYDSKELYNCLKPKIIQSIKYQANFGAERKIIISLGRKNGKFLTEINDEIMLFDEIVELDHPRYIMQYKRKSLRKYVDLYLHQLDWVFNEFLKKSP